MTDHDRLVSDRRKLIESIRNLSAPARLVRCPLAVLRLPQGSTEAEIREAHRRLSIAALDRQDGVAFDEIQDALETMLGAESDE